MLESPVVNAEFKGKEGYKIREENPEKFLGDP